MFPGAGGGVDRASSFPMGRAGDGRRATGFQPPRRVRTEPELVERTIESNRAPENGDDARHTNTDTDTNQYRVTIDDYFGDDTPPPTNDTAPQGSSSSDTITGGHQRENNTATAESSTHTEAINITGNVRFSNHDTTGSASQPNGTPAADPLRFRRWGDVKSGVQWVKNKPLEFGRILLIDYMKTERGLLKIVAQEFHDIRTLRRFFENPERSNPARLVLRLIHAQNAESWARPFLLKKFGIGEASELNGLTEFASWIDAKRPELRMGRAPILKAKKWRAQRDPWRNIRRTACSFDYLMAYPVKPEADPNGDKSQKTRHIDPDEWRMMELASYTDTGDVVLSSHVHVQRLSFYIQKEDADGDSYYAQPSEETPFAPPYQMPGLDSLDNHNAILIFEHGRSSSANDSLIQARGEIESHWRRLMFYLRKSDIEVDDPSFALMEMITKDIFRGLQSAWEDMLAAANSHTTIIEDRIYDSPADETLAPELWSTAKEWLKIERLVSLHCDVVKEFTEAMNELLPSDDSRYFQSLEDLYSQFERHAVSVEEELVKPISTLTTVMFQAVSFRDTRHSVQLNTSLWRLSWITFIFLPLTFSVGFFGMNVDAFADSPSIKWFFVMAVPLMILVVFSYYIVKESGVQKIEDPFKKRTIDPFSRDLAVAYPRLWTPAGPRESIQPQEFITRLRLKLMGRWFGADSRSFDQNTLKKSKEGFAERRKRRLTLSWLKKLDRQVQAQEESEVGFEAGTHYVNMASSLSERVPTTSRRTYQRANPDTTATNIPE